MHNLQLDLLFSKAIHYVRNSGFGNEITWYAGKNFEKTCEQELLRESAWVVLCSGFRESAVRRVFGYISWCFYDWSNASEIAHNGQDCIRLASLRFRHEGKLKAIVDIASTISDQGFESLKKRIRAEPIRTLMEFPYIGEITSYHLAKNLGLPFAKPDRHMESLRKMLGSDSVEQLCEDISNAVGLPVHLVDTVLWRFCALGGKQLI